MAPKAKTTAQKVSQQSKEIDKVVESIESLKVVDLINPSPKGSNTAQIKKNSRGRVIRPPNRFNS